MKTERWDQKQGVVAKTITLLALTMLAVVAVAARQSTLHAEIRAEADAREKFAGQFENETRQRCRITHKPADGNDDLIRVATYDVIDTADIAAYYRDKSKQVLSLKCWDETRRVGAWRDQDDTGDDSYIRWRTHQ